MKDVQHYATRDTEALGQHYLSHVGAMTSEQLHSKSAIAAELAVRDERIAELEKSLEKDRKRFAALAVMGEREYVLLQSEMKVTRNDWLDVAISNVDEFLSLRPVNCPVHPELIKEASGD